MWPMANQITENVSHDWGLNNVHVSSPRTVLVHEIGYISFKTHMTMYCELIKVYLHNALTFDSCSM